MFLPIQFCDAKNFREQRQGNSLLVCNLILVILLSSDNSNISAKSGAYTAAQSATDTVTITEGDPCYHGVVRSKDYLVVLGNPDHDLE